MAPMSLLCSHLRERRVLLVLDNAELLRELPPLLLALLEAAPALKVLLTSRIRVGLAAEVMLEVAPLPVLAASAVAANGVGAPSAVLALFMQRALENGHAVNPADRATALRICARLDGLPLALELAAARLRAMNLTTLEDELTRSLRGVGGGQDPPPAASAACKTPCAGAPDCCRRVRGGCCGGWRCFAAASICPGCWQFAATMKGPASARLCWTG